MLSTDALIWAALRTVVLDMRLTPAMEIIDPSAEFTPGADPFVLVSDVRNPNTRPLIGAGRDLRSGTLIINAVYPVDWLRARSHYQHARILQESGVIASYFPEGLCLQAGGRIRIIRSPDVQQPYRVDTLLYAPVSIPWEHTPA